MPPGVAEAIELGLPYAWVVVDRDLAHLQAAPVSLEDHLRGELHARRVEIENGQRLAADGTHPAMGIRDLDSEEDVQHARQDRVADEPVQKRHGVAMDRSFEARADYEVVTVLQPVDERCELAHRIRLVGVPHDDVVTLRRREPGEVGAAVSASRLRHDAGAVVGRHLGGGVD